jgi:hypothetical protein
MAMAASTSVGAPVCGSAVATVDAVEGVEARGGPPLPVLDGGEGVELGVPFVVGELVEASVGGALVGAAVVVVPSVEGGVVLGGGAGDVVEESVDGVAGCEVVVVWHGWITPPFV